MNKQVRFYKEESNERRNTQLYPESETELNLLHRRKVDQQLHTEISCIPPITNHIVMMIRTI